MIDKPESQSGRGLTVQEVAERTGLSAHTLRYYEKAGLLPRVGRDDSSGHRRYAEGDLRFIEFLKRLRATGMPICRMQEYVALVRAGEATLAERRDMLIGHGEAVRERIADLQASLAVIEWKVENYRLGMEKASQGASGGDCVSSSRGEDQ